MVATSRGREYLTALLRRLTKTCSSRTAKDRREWASQQHQHPGRFRRDQRTGDGGLGRAPPRSEEPDSSLVANFGADSGRLLGGDCVPGDDRHLGEGNEPLLGAGHAQRPLQRLAGEALRVRRKEEEVAGGLLK